MPASAEKAINEMCRAYVIKLRPYSFCQDLLGASSGLLYSNNLSASQRQN
jgi:hypothetical protein